MKKILIVSEKVSSFYSKYLINLVNSLLRMDAKIFLLLGEKSKIKFDSKVKIIESHDFNYFSKNLDEHRYLEVFKIAHENDINQIHFIRLFDPQRFYLALKSREIGYNFNYSFSIFGISEYLRRDIYSHYLEKLMKLGVVKKGLVHTIHPQSAQLHCSMNGYLQYSNIHFVKDPIYDDINDYSLSQKQAREKLNLNNDKVIILYFGAYFLSKGPDILLEVAQNLKNIKDILFVFAGDTTTASFNFIKSDYFNENVLFDDRFIDDETVASYLIASDIIVLPYRKFYEHNTSGVLVQACLARRPVLVPDISPFRETITEEKLGYIFSCESGESLKNEIINFVNQKADLISFGFSNYLSKIESWDTIANMILN